MKTKRNAIALLLVACVLFAFAGCGKEKITEQPSDTEETQTSYTKNTAKNKKQPECAVKFVNALCDEDYQAILDLLYLPENSVVSPDNIRTFLLRSNLVSFIGSDCIEITESNKTDTEIITMIKSNADTCEIDFMLNENNEFVLQMGKAFMEKDVIAPGDASIRINGISLDSMNAYMGTYADDVPGLVSYHLVCPNTDFTAYVSTSIADYEIFVTRTEDDEPYDLVNYELEPTVTNAICEETKKIFNDLLTDLKDGNKNVKDLQKYFTENADSADISEIISWYEKANIPTDCYVYELQQNGKEPSYVVSDDTIKLCTQFRTKWTENDKEKDCHDYATFVMEKKNGSWKIASTDISEKGNFFCNPFNHMW